MRKPFGHPIQPTLMLGAGLLVWSTWSSLRIAPWGLHPPQAAVAVKAPAVSAASRRAGQPLSPEEKLRLVHRLGQGLSQPQRLSDEDLHAARTTWGGSAAALLSLIR